MIELLFYLFAISLTISVTLVVTLRNPVYSVLLLILSLMNSSALFILIGAEYLAMTLIIVYVGAVAVLFLFIVMMMNIRTNDIPELKLLYSIPPIIISVSIFMVVYMFIPKEYGLLMVEEAIPGVVVPSNTEAIGYSIYTDHILQFEIAGVILLIAMIGAIVLTLEQKSVKKNKSQNILAQVMRSREDAVELVEVVSKKGIKL